MNETDIPVFEMTEHISEQLSRIDELLEKSKHLAGFLSDIAMVNESRARAIDASQAIEGNTLGLKGVRDMVNGKIPRGSLVDILEISNAIDALAAVETADLWSTDDFQSIHGKMMDTLVEETGFRHVGVGISNGVRMIYVAPDHEKVPGLMGRLFEWGRSTDLPRPVVAAITHYYIEAVHPFEDGNGRMGRLWHSAIMESLNPLFRLVPVEPVFRARQQEYYAVLRECQNHEPHDCTRFVEFCLDSTVSALEDV